MRRISKIGASPNCQLKTADCRLPTAAPSHPSRASQSSLSFSLVNFRIFTRLSSKSEGRPISQFLPACADASADRPDIARRAKAGRFPTRLIRAGQASEFRIPNSQFPYLLFLPLLLLLLLLSGCYEPQEGCLDLEAVNYDFSADENNPEDCDYPELRLQFNHRFVGTDSIYNFRFDSTYLDSEGNPFTFQDLRFYISNVRLLGANGTSYGVEEELTVFIPQDGDTSEVFIEDNFAIVSPSNLQTLNMGTMRESYSVSGMRFAVGVEGLANRGDPSRLASSHPLSLRDSSLYFSADSGYVFNSIRLFRDTTAADTIPEVLRIGTDPYLQAVELPLTAEKPRGFHYKVVLGIDYTKWFSDINVKQDTKEVLIEKIVSNITESFTVIEVEIEGD